MASTIPVSEAIEALLDEVEKSVKAGQDHDLRFLVDEVKLELQVTATTEGPVDAKVKWLIFEAGDEASHQSAHVQTITLTLKAVTQSPDGQTTPLLLSSPEG
ncbi:MAG: hypothetical protein LBK42_04785 [Propionibacteriaceae bacterium]|jgi:hypothetical protein|nr:hypothetical protein [Propionibacteriaceae bacterium]